MPEPGADGIDVDTSSQEVSCRGMANRMGTDALGGERRHVSTSLSDMTLHERVNAESCDRFATAIEEDPVTLRASANQSAQGGGCLRPEQTMPHFVSLPADLHRRIFVTRHMPECEIADGDLRRFVGARTGVVEKQQECVVSTPVGCFNPVRVK